MIKNLSCCPWNNTHHTLIKQVLAIHSESLATTSLTISKYCTVVALHNIVNHLPANEVKNLLLCGRRIENMVESENQIVVVSVELLLKSD